MKAKYLILASLLLAIMTIGAVSASDDCDNLTVCDDIGDDLSNVDEVDAIAEEADTDVIGAGEDTREELDHDVRIPEKIRTGELSVFDDDPDKFYMYVDLDKGDVEGSIAIFIDNEVRYNQSVEDYYFGNGAGLNLHDLNLNCSTHYVKIQYSGDEKYLPFEETGQFDVYYMDVQVPESGEINYGFYVDFALDATGSLDFYLDDEFIRTYDVYKDRRYVYDDEEGGSYYDEPVSGLFIDLEDFALGEYDYTFKYYDGNYDDKNVSGSFNLSYYFHVYVPSSLDYGDELIFEISLPDDAMADVILSFNGENYTIKHERGYFEYSFYDYEYGVNNFTFIYKDSNYPEKKVNVGSNITSRYYMPDSYDVGYNSDEEVSIVLPDDAEGYLVIYAEGGKVVKSAKVIDGEASISLNDLDLGNYWVMYNGTDYSIDEMYVHSFAVAPNVIYTEAIWARANEDYPIIVETPASAQGDLIIAIYEEVSEGNLEPEGPVMVLYNDTADETVTVYLTKDFINQHTEDKVYIIRVTYSNETVHSSNRYLFVIKEHSPDWNMKVSYRSWYDYYEFNIDNLPESYDWDRFGSIDGEAVLYINGKRVGSFDLRDNDGVEAYDVKKGDKWEVRFFGDTYYNDINVSGVIGSSGSSNPAPAPAAPQSPPQVPATPAPAKQAVKLTLKKVNVKKSAKKLVLQATLKINSKWAKGKILKFKFNGKTYKAKTNKNGVAKVTIKSKVLKKLKVGKKIKIQVSYAKTVKNLTVKVKK